VNYTAILSRSFRLFWHHRALWALGAMAAFFGVTQYRFSLNFNSPFSRSGEGPSEDLPPGLRELFEPQALGAVLERAIPYLIGLLIAGLIWALICFVLGWLAQGAMVAMVDEIDQGGASSLRAGIARSRERLGALLGAVLLLALPVIVILVIVAVIILGIISTIFTQYVQGPEQPDGALAGIFSAMLCLVPLFLLAALLGVVLYLVTIFAVRSCVLEGLGAVAGIRRGWYLLTRGVGYVILTWLLLGMAGGLIGGMAALPGLVLMIPIGQAMMDGAWSNAASVAAVAGVLYLLVANTAVGGILTALDSTLWTVLYRAIRARDDAKLGAAAEAMR
jgi:hypothetical protein